MTTANTSALILRDPWAAVPSLGNLDAYVSAQGQMSDPGCQQQVSWLDEQFSSGLNPNQLDGYQRWKSDADNALAFLFRKPGPDQALDCLLRRNRPDFKGPYRNQ